MQLVSLVHNKTFEYEDTEDMKGAVHIRTKERQIAWMKFAPRVNIFHIEGNLEQEYNTRRKFISTTTNPGSPTESTVDRLHRSVVGLLPPPVLLVLEPIYRTLHRQSS